MANFVVPQSAARSNSRVVGFKQQHRTVFFPSVWTAAQTEANGKELSEWTNAAGLQAVTMQSRKAQVPTSKSSERLTGDPSMSRGCRCRKKPLAWSTLLRQSPVSIFQFNSVVQVAGSSTGEFLAARRKTLSFPAALPPEKLLQANRKQDQLSLAASL